MGFPNYVVRKMSNYATSLQHLDMIFLIAGMDYKIPSREILPYFNIYKNNKKLLDLNERIRLKYPKLIGNSFTNEYINNNIFYCERKELTIDLKYSGFKSLFSVSWEPFVDGVGSIYLLNSSLNILSFITIEYDDNVLCRYTNLDLLLIQNIYKNEKYVPLFNNVMNNKNIFPLFIKKSSPLNIIFEHNNNYNNSSIKPKLLMDTYEVKSSHSNIKNNYNFNFNSFFSCGREHVTTISYSTSMQLLDNKPHYGMIIYSNAEIESVKVRISMLFSLNFTNIDLEDYCSLYSLPNRINNWYVYPIIFGDINIKKFLTSSNFKNNNCNLMNKLSNNSSIVINFKQPPNQNTFYEISYLFNSTLNIND
tara:strand:+ start:2081 stop:3172 length:1092 start_codon:yes stop_codon:yes gene_type:complete